MINDYVIPDKLLDKTTVYKNHNTYTHLFCIMIRIILGLYIVTCPKANINIVLWICIAVILMFSIKFITNDQTWKVYLRTIISYSTSAYLLKYNKRDAAGLLIITDALLAVQSRHIATLFNKI